jgi:glutamine synthetase
MWGFDGSSTYQAEGGDSDLTLRPVRIAPDPIRGEGNYLVLCEVTDSDGEPHRSNTRAHLRRLLQGPAGEAEAWFGFEQEYTLFKDGRPLGFPENGYPRPQGPFYCGVGGERVFGRDFVEAHMRACMDAGLMIYGVNAEVMPGQWEFQIGHRGVSGESSDPLTVSDHLILARWLMQRVGERFGVDPRLDPKPVQGDWNGAGAHTNFSTRSMREPGGLAEIRAAIDKLGRRHDLHVGRYGYGLADRLTGLHETCSIEEFKGGVADRGASIRVPRHVETRGAGYLEDRRPGANCDPYVVCAALLETVCDSRELAAAG